MNLLTYAQTSGLFVTFGAQASVSFALCVEFLKLCDSQPALSATLKEVAVAVRAIAAQLALERNNEPQSIRWWLRSGVEPGWFKVLKRAPTPGRFVMFGAYVGRSITRCAAFLRICKSRSNVPKPLRDAAEAVRVISTQLTPRPWDSSSDGLQREIENVPLSRRPAVLSIAAVSILAIGFSLHVYSERESGWESYSTKVGDYRRIQLRDGSTVEMNTASTIKYRDSNGVREIVLPVGEARFRVAHDAARPFVVLAGNIAIRDIGTEFSVRVWDGGKVEVRVIEGEVGVSHQVPRSMLESLLHPPPIPLRGGTSVVEGHKATDDNGKLSSVEMSHTQMENRDSWRNNELVFEELPLEEIVGELNRYSNRKIQIMDPAISRTVLGGRIKFKPRDLEGALAKLETVLPIEVSASASKDGSAVVIRVYKADPASIGRTN